MTVAQLREIKYILFKDNPIKIILNLPEDKLHEFCTSLKQDMEKSGLYIVGEDNKEIPVMERSWYTTESASIEVNHSDRFSIEFKNI